MSIFLWPFPVVPVQPLTSVNTQLTLTQMKSESNLKKALGPTFLQGSPTLLWDGWGDSLDCMCDKTWASALPVGCPSHSDPSCGLSVPRHHFPVSLSVFLTHLFPGAPCLPAGLSLLQSHPELLGTWCSNTRVIVIVFSRLGMEPRALYLPGSANELHSASRTTMITKFRLCGAQNLKGH